MFSRAATNPLDDIVTKATDENLTSENWELILTVCDKVDADNENGARNAIAAIQKRLSHRNANVQLFSLSLAEALSKNCGSKVHREIASRAFTQSLLRLTNDRTIHSKVKTRTGQLVKEWADGFKADPSLGIMTETYNTLRSQGISLDPPSRPQKREITEVDRRREEEELQIALAMSLQETKIARPTASGERAPQAPRNEVDNGPNAYTLPSLGHNGAYVLPTPSNFGTQASDHQIQQAPAAERTAATVSRCRALYDFVASEPGELTFRRGDTITVIESAYKDWWRGSLHGSIGIFPTNYVENLAEPTFADLQREAEEEARVFAEAKNVEKLLSILSSVELSDPSLAENEQLQNLYHSTISIRPKLVRLIEKYAQKKDDLISLNEKFTKARKDYDELMEAALARYETTRSYAPRQAYDSRTASQRVAVNNGYPTEGYDRRRASSELRQAPPDQEWVEGVRHTAASTNADPYQQQYAHFEQPDQGDPQSSFQLQQRSSANPQPSAPYQSPQASRYQIAKETSYPSSAYDSVAAPGPNQVRQNGGQNTHAPRSFSGVPTSPSQELNLAFSPVASAQQRPRSSSYYDPSRADLPPISYYEEEAVPPQYATPMIPNTSGSGRDTQNHDSSADPADYYR